MKKQLAYLLIGSVIFSTSCKKEIYGCTDNLATNFSNVANKDDGSCFYIESSVKSTTVTISNWTQNGNNWVTVIPYGEITSTIIDEGAAVIYQKEGTNNWKSLPLTFYQSDTYSTTIEVVFTIGQALVYWKNSDDTLPVHPGEQIFKVAVIS